MKVAITGCAGFIGSNLVDRLLVDGHQVVGLDNFSTGQEYFLKSARQNKNFKLLQGDLLDKNFLLNAFEGCELVCHLSANADVRRGTDFPSKDLHQNTIATFNVLEAMRNSGVTKIIFSSTGSVYGEANVIPTPEYAPFPIQTSLYGASKVAGEALISAYCEGFNFQSWIFRFVSILGERYTHGHIFDFYKQLKSNPNRLMVLGDGTQKKSYLYVQDCVEAILAAFNSTNEKVNIFNLGVDGYCEVNDSIGWICDELGLSPLIEYSGGPRGWVGDNPFIYLDTAKIKKTGWRACTTIENGVRRTVRYLRENEWVFSAGGSI